MGSTSSSSGANDPAAMLRHTQECKERGIPFAADPSQQVAWLEGPDIRTLVDGAAYLFTNEYEAAVTEKKTGWSAGEILERVDVRVTTFGGDGARIEQQGAEPVHVPVAKVDKVLEPTGVGDGFRAGFLSARSWGLSLERAAQVGSLVAAHVIETVGTAGLRARPGRVPDRDWRRPTAPMRPTRSSPT